MPTLPTSVQLALEFDSRYCTRCHRDLPLSSFTPRGDAPHRLRSHCQDCLREAKREYNERNREKRAASCRRYYRENAEACKERIRKSVANDATKYRDIHAQWKRRNKDAVNASTHKRRARISANGGSWSGDDWQRLKARYDWRCLMCGRQEMTDGVTLCFDHVVPVSLGGWNLISNGQPLCKSCNSKKHRTILDLRPDFP